MNLEELRKYRHHGGVAIIIIALIIYKFRFLSLPYFWDEAWPYSVGVHNLYDNGLSLMPGAISSFVARGHPLMFHFLAAAWMNVFGTSLLSGHSFSMFVSILLIITIYVFCKTFFSERVGFIACLLFSCQAIFIAQSAFLMPEVLMALWTMVCFLAFFREKNILFVVFGTAMLLTKESGGVFFIALFFYECFVFIAANEKDYKGLFKKLSLICIPVLLASVNFIIQKIKFGWFLYPFYLDHVSFSWRNFTETLPSAAAYSFIYYGRNGFSIFFIISLLVIFIFRKIKFTQNEKKVISFFSVFIASYLIFSSVNYYIPRYLMCIFPPFYIIGTVLIDKAFSRIKIIYPLVISGLIITSIFFYLQPRRYGDMDYSPSVNTDLQMVEFCEKQKLYDEHILVRGLLSGDLTEAYDGYLSGKKFNHIEWGFSGETEYCIFSGDEDNNAEFDKIKNEHKLELIKRFEQKYAWCEIYKVVH